MLTVGVDLDDDVVVTPLRKAEPRAHRTPDAQVVGQRQDLCAGPAGDTGGVIGRAVVHHEDVRVRSHLAHFFDDVADRRLFVPRRDDDEQPARTREWHEAQRTIPSRGVCRCLPEVSCNLTAVPRVFPCTRWATGLALIALLGLAVRLVYILGFRYPMVAGGHAFYYQAGANLLVEGHGFIQPTDYFQEHWTVQAAEHPPLYIAAAFLAAVYPNFWANDGLVLSETLAQLTTVIVILLAYRFWERRDRASALWLGRRPRAGDPQPRGVGTPAGAGGGAARSRDAFFLVAASGGSGGYLLGRNNSRYRPMGGVQPHPFRASGHHQHRARPNLEVVQLRRRLVRAREGLLGIVAHKGPPARGPGPVQPGACVPAGVHRLHQGPSGGRAWGAAGS